MQSYRDEIKSAIHLARQDRDDLVPFVGAGISIPAGLPSWSELLQQLAGGGDELSDSLDQPAQALQRIEERLRTTEFTRRVQQALQVSPESAMTLALYALIQTGVTKIVTTNLDLVIESAFEKAGRPFGAHDVFRGPLPEELAGFDQNHLSCRLFKIHGSLERPSTWVLTQDQYDRAYIEPGPLKSFISQKIRIPFFLGFSFSDFDVDECLRIARIRGKRSYSLVPIDQAPRLDQKLRSKGVIPIYFYNYAQIPEVIDEVFGTRPIEISHRHRTTPEKESVLEVGWAKVPTGEIAS